MTSFLVSCPVHVTMLPFSMKRFKWVSRMNTIPVLQLKNIKQNCFHAIFLISQPNPMIWPSLKSSLRDDSIEWSHHRVWLRNKTVSILKTINFRPYLLPCFWSGGRDIKSDCDARIKRKGQLQDGEVYLGSGGDLPCKSIAHVVIAPWDSGSKDTETLESVVTGCLQKSDQRGCTSIVIPGLGTGQLHYPTGIACDTIVRTIKSYFEKVTYCKSRSVFYQDWRMLNVGLK